VGVLADLVVSAVNPNLGLWRGGPAGTAIELQSIDWLKELLGYPPEAEGVYSSGGQFANVLALAVMRDRMAGWDVRTAGTNAGPHLRLYVSEELHYCHQQAAELLGMGREALRLVPTDEACRMRLNALQEMIAADRATGDKPISVIASAGTIGTGAVDPIPALRELTRAEGLWLHLDGAYGHSPRSPRARPRSSAPWPRPTRSLATRRSGSLLRSTLGSRSCASNSSHLCAPIPNHLLARR